MKRTQKSLSVLPLVAALLVLGGCGQKGPLYLPKEPEPAQEKTPEQPKQSNQQH